MFRVIEIVIPEFVAKLLTTLGAERHHGYSLDLRRPLSDTISLCSLSVTGTSVHQGRNAALQPTLEGFEVWL